MAGNALAQGADWGRAQQLADEPLPKDLHGWFDELARQALLAVRADDVARFLGKRLVKFKESKVAH
jgi:hypothetical protein